MDWLKLFSQLQPSEFTNCNLWLLTSLEEHCIWKSFRITSKQNRSLTPIAFHIELFYFFKEIQNAWQHEKILAYCSNFKLLTIFFGMRIPHTNFNPSKLKGQFCSINPFTQSKIDSSQRQKCCLWTLGCRVQPSECWVLGFLFVC